MSPLLMHKLRGSKGHTYMTVSFSIKCSEVIGSIFWAVLRYVVYILAGLRYEDVC